MRVGTDRVTEILNDLHAAFPGAGAAAVTRLVTASRNALPVTGVALCWMTDSGPGAMLAATDARAQLLEELQFNLGEGPCIASSATGRPALHADLARTGAALWPAFSAAATRAGVAAVFAFPLQVVGIKVGVLDLYRDEPGELAERDLAEALAFAAAATTVLLDLQAAAVVGELHPKLIEVLAGRAEVHQATGMVAVQSAVSLGDALTLLRARAFAAERPIVDIAREVVARRIRFDS